MKRQDQKPSGKHYSHQIRALQFIKLLIGQNKYWRNSNDDFIDIATFDIGNSGINNIGVLYKKKQRGLLYYFTIICIHYNDFFVAPSCAWL